MVDIFELKSNKSKKSSEITISIHFLNSSLNNNLFQNIYNLFEWVVQEVILLLVW